MWSDSSLNMSYGNQWMNPALYKNMTNEQVDWASLAQQWIKMKETTPTIPLGQQERSANCESNFLRPSQPIIDHQIPSNVMVASKSLTDHNITGPITGNNIEKPSAWNTWSWQQQQQWNWNWASSSAAPPTKTPIIESVNPIRPPYVAPPLLTEPPPPFPIISSNKQQFSTNNFWTGPPNSRIPPSIETDQWSKPNMLPTVDDRSQDSSYIDAVKRKQLPAWIREGLEKMEREKRRKVDLEQSYDESENSCFNNENVSQEIHISPNNFNSETQMIDDDEVEHDSPDYINDSEPKRTEFVKNDTPPLIPRKTKAQIWEDTMLNLRQILTKLLMEVTNDMMLSVVKEVLKTTSHTDIQGNQSQTSLAGKLGLGVYGSESESSDEDYEEQSSGHRQSLKQDSDEAIQERILKRQREFSNIEARILIELDQLEDREKHVRSKFDNSIKLGGEIIDNGSQVVENIQTKGRIEDEESSQKLEKDHNKIKKEMNNFNKNGQKKKKSKSKRSTSSSTSSSSTESKRSNDTDSKYSYKKTEKIKSKYSNKKSKTDNIKRKRRSHSRSRSYSRSKRSRSRSRHYDRRSPHNYRSRRSSRSPISRRGNSRKYKSKRNSSSSSNESRSTKHRYRR